MRSVVFVFFFFLSTSFCTSGSAAPYFGVFGGGTADFDLNNSRIDTSWGYYAGAKLGFTCCCFLRFEEEFSYQSSKVESLYRKGLQFHNVHGEVNFWSLMTNGLIDFDCPFFVTPYLGGGIGYAHGSGEGKGSLKSKRSARFKEEVERDTFAWQGIVGLKYLVCLGLETSLEYRYFKIKDVDANHKVGLALTKIF